MPQAASRRIRLDDASRSTGQKSRPRKATALGMAINHGEKVFREGDVHAYGLGARAGAGTRMATAPRFTASAMTASSDEGSGTASPSSASPSR